MIRSTYARDRRLVNATWSGMAVVAIVLAIFWTTHTGLAPLPAHTDPPALNRAASPADLPLAFIPNVGQATPDTRFLIQDHRQAITFSANEIVFRSLGRSPASEPALVHLHFEGSAPHPQLNGTERLPGVVNYFLGADPAGWYANVPTYAGITYEQLYPGIDLRYDSVDQRLKGTYFIAPGADPGQIRWRYSGGGGPRIAPATGDLIVDLPSGGTLTEQAPVAWQTVAGERIAVAAYFSLANDGSVGFRLGAYDPQIELIIDPVLVFSTLLGGGNFDEAEAITVDEAGNSYVAGSTASNDLFANPVRERRGGEDIFVAKINPAGTALIYTTYLGGSQDGPDPDDRGDEVEGTNSITVDSRGNLYLTGATDAIDFPITADAFQREKTGIPYSDDAYVTKLNANGAISWSTYLGGRLVDEGEGIAVDEAGDVYVTGFTSSSNFPTRGAFQPALAGDGDAFVVKLNAGGSTLLYGTFLGGGGFDAGAGLKLEPGGEVVLVGTTASDNFPIRSATQDRNNGGSDIFVARLNAPGSELTTSTYLGGRGNETAEGIALDRTGAVFVTGITLSDDFPVVNPLQGSFASCDDMTGPCGDAFVAKLGPGASGLRYSTFLGGSSRDDAFDIAVTGTGEAVVVGATLSRDFPTRDSLQPYAGGGDAFIVKINEHGSATVYSTFLGGSSIDIAHAVAVGSGGDALVAGFSLSRDFPLVRPIEAAHSGLSDMFVARISDDAGTDPEPTPSPTPSGTPTLPPPSGFQMRSLTIGDRDVLVDRDVTLFIDVTGTDAQTTMYLREWELVTTEDPPLWRPVQSSGWKQFRAEVPWRLGSRAGTHLVAVWLRDQAGHTTRLSTASIDTASLLLPDSTVPAERPAIYRIAYRAGDPVRITMDVARGDADLYLWYPNEFLLPNQFSFLPGTRTETIRFTAPRSGIYYLVVFGFISSTYTLSIEPGGGPRSTTAAGESAAPEATSVTLVAEDGSHAQGMSRSLPNLGDLLDGIGTDPLASIDDSTPVEKHYLPMMVE